MQVQRLSPAAKTTTAASLEKGVAAALKDIQKIQGRMTEELRAEDAIRGLSVQGGKVVADIDGRFDYPAAGLKQVVAEHLAKHGVKNATVTLHTLADPQKAIDAANADITKIQARLTRDLRAEDGIVNLSSQGGSKVAVVLKARQPFAEADVAGAVKQLLAKHGLKNAQLEMIRPAINIRPVSSVVGEAWAAIQQVQGRLTTDIRAEDDILNVTLGGHGGTDAGDVRVVLKAHPNFSEADIKKAVEAHLTKAGLDGANIVFIRPAVNPFRPPNAGGGAAQNKMKAKVDVLAADIRTVQSRMTEELRIEDAIKTIKVVGAKVVLTLHAQGPFEKDGVAAWAREELTKRGITLPLVVKT